MQENWTRYLSDTFSYQEQLNIQKSPTNWEKKRLETTSISSKKMHLIVSLSDLYASHYPHETRITSLTDKNYWVVTKNHKEKTTKAEFWKKKQLQGQKQIYCSLKAEISLRSVLDGKMQTSQKNDSNNHIRHTKHHHIKRCYRKEGTALQKLQLSGTTNEPNQTRYLENDV